MFGCPSRSTVQNKKNPLKYYSSHIYSNLYVGVLHPNIYMIRLFYSIKHSVTDFCTFFGACSGVYLCGEAQTARHQVGAALQVLASAFLRTAALLDYTLVARYATGLRQINTVLTSRQINAIIYHCERNFSQL